MQRFICRVNITAADITLSAAHRTSVCAAPARTTGRVAVRATHSVISEQLLGLGTAVITMVLFSLENIQLSNTGQLHQPYTIIIHIRSYAMLIQDAYTQVHVVILYGKLLFTCLKNVIW